MSDNFNSDLKRIEFLRSEIKKHNYLYYQLDKPELLDAAYDELCKELMVLENSHMIQEPDSQTRTIGGGIDKRFNKLPHIRPMLSLGNAFSFEDIGDFYERIKKSFPLANFICEPKIDGLSFSAIYNDGKLQHALTRGDGKYGEEITENFKQLIDVPLFINFKEELEVRGEIYISKDDFLQLNHDRISEMEEEFANPRNAAAGSLRQLNSEIVKKRKLRYFVWGGFLEDCRSQAEFLLKMQELGFCVNKEIVICNELKEINNYYLAMYQKRAELLYDIDGLVYKVNNIDIQKNLGQTSKAPRWAVAHKFPAEVAVTRIEDIIIQVGRTGVLTPVAILKPINVGGVLVSRATLHNEEEIKRKDFRIGDVVDIKRAGDVIPQIIKVDLSKRTGEEKIFDFPKHCPACDSEVERLPKEAAIRCTGGRNCPAQLLEYLCYFVDKDAFNIIGFGAKQIEEFFNSSLIKNPVDIFKIPYLDSNILRALESKNGWGAKSISNLLASIEKSKNISLDKFIYSLGIRHVGQVNAEIIARHFKTFDDFYSELKNNKFEDLERIDGIGPIMLDSIRKFFSNKHNIDFVEKLSHYITVSEVNDIFKKDSLLYGKKIIFTGSLNSMSRDEAEKISKEFGANIVSSISKKTDFIIIGTGGGSKLEKAKKLGIETLSEQEWLSILSTVSSV